MALIVQGGLIMRRKITQRVVTGVGLALLPVVPLWAQTVPADLVDVSIEQLFDANVISDSERDNESKRWHISYRFARSTFDEYYLGTRALTYDDVLWEPTEARTRNNYPVVPTKITQSVQALLLGYDYSDALTLRLSLPYIRQSSDHISIVPGYDDFNISSSGIGDTVLLADYVVNRSINSLLRAHVGVSVPTGSIDEQGDTPRAPGDQQLPYTMQMGSGTWDFPLALAYEKYENTYRWGLDARVTWRSGDNDRDYRLGHKARIGGWVSSRINPWLEPGIGLTYRWQGEISGEDAELSVPNPQFPYPAPVADPNDFGGEQVDLSVFVHLRLNDAGSYARLEYSNPVYLDLNGPQSAQNEQIQFSIGTAF